jgi:hypothetical protein
MTRKRRKRAARSGPAVDAGAPLLPETPPPEPPQQPCLDHPAERLRQFEDARRPQVPAEQTEAEGGFEPPEGRNA